VLQLIKRNFAPGDKLVFTQDSSDSMGSLFPELSSSDVAVQAFETSKGRKLLIINKRLREVNLNLAKIGPIGTTTIVDEKSRGGAPHTMPPNGEILHLRPFAVAVVEVSKI
jgi:hypothetical protein